MTDESVKNIFENTPGYLEAKELLGLLEKSGSEAYLVGGCVRDALLELKVSDFDLATSATPEEMLEIFKDYKVLNHGIAFGTLGVVVNSIPFEITSYRGEGEYVDSRHPSEVNFLNSKDEDLKRRDFTINAMMFHPEEGLYDPYGGRKDLVNKMIKTVGNPVERFKDDSLRIIRMIRFSLNLGFKIEPLTLSAAKSMMTSILKLSKERVFSEIEKTLNKKIYDSTFVSVRDEFLPNFECGLLFDKNLSDLEKAYFLKCLNVELPTLGEIIIKKDLKKDLDFFKLLSDEKNRDVLEKSIVKFTDKIESTKEKQELLDMMNLLLGKEGRVQVKSEQYLEYPSESLMEKISDLKKNLSDAELGEAILKAKKAEIFSQ